MRVLCITCDESHPVAFNPVDPPDVWFKCPKCGPLEQIESPTGSTSRAQKRNIRKGGAIIRGRPHTTK